MRNFQEGIKNKRSFTNDVLASFVVFLVALYH